MRYPTVLLDLDHTLLDSDASELAAFDQTLRRAGAEDSAAFLESYRAINASLWTAVERGELSPNEVRVLRFERLVDESGLAADPHRMADDFVHGLGANGRLYPGARDLLDRLAGIATMALVTNGIGEVQRARIERLELEPYFTTVVISGEAGVAKPDPAIFDLVFRHLGGGDRSSAVMVGDSLSSDIQGGANAGVDTCWYNRHATPGDPPATVTHEVRTLPEVYDIVVGGGPA